MSSNLAEGRTYCKKKESERPFGPIVEPTMEAMVRFISSHIVKYSQVHVATKAMGPTVLTSQKTTKRNANRQKESSRAHRGAPRYYSEGVLVANCHRCRITYPIGQHLTSTTSGFKQPATNELLRHPGHTLLNLERPKQEIS